MVSNQGLPWLASTNQGVIVNIAAGLIMINHRF